MKSKIYVLLGFCFLCTEYILAQSSALINESPITFNGSYIGDVVRNFSGGIKKGTSYLGLANFRVSFDTKKLHLWNGGQIFINAANTHGGNPSADLIGDFHIVSNIETDELTYFHELWYKQTFDHFEIIAGLQDLNTDYLSTESGSTFLNSTFGTPTTIASNIPSPIFPLTALGISLKWNISSNKSWKIAVFDGFPTDFSNNPHNLRWKLDKNEGVFAVSEYQQTGYIKSKLKGSYKAGIYYHSQLSGPNDESKISEKNKSNYGLYLIVDQMIYQKDKESGGLGLFVQFAISPKTINSHYRYLGLGLSWQGLFSNRDEDKIGAGFNKAWLNDSSIKSESIIEIFYKAQLTNNLFIQPDFQYVINPGGTNVRLNNAFVGLVRFGLNF